MTESKKLKGKIALVAGGTRGAGRAIAVSLAEAGAFVYVTGRSSRKRGLPSQRPETIEETLDLIEAAGGSGAALRVDHNLEEDVRALMKRIDAEQNGRLDILVNDIWGGEARTSWLPFWEQNVDVGIAVFDNAVMTHVRTATYATPLLMRSEPSLILEITDGVGYHYRGSVYYSLVKICTNHLVQAYSADFKERGITGITSVGLTPGFLRSEEMLSSFGVSESDWRSAVKDHPDFAGSETPYYLGRALVELAIDPEVRRFDGQVLSTWGMSKIYDFADTDGTRPDWERFHNLLKEGKIDPFTWKY